MPKPVHPWPDFAAVSGVILTTATNRNGFAAALGFAAAVEDVAAGIERLGE